MPHEANISCESEEDIDNQHYQDLVRHRMSSRLEIHIEIGKEGHTESWYPDRIPLREEPEGDSDENCISEEKKDKLSSRHTRLYLRSCRVEEVCIHEDMEDIAMKKLVKKELT